MNAQVSIDEALADTGLLGAALGDGSTWQMWRVTLKAAFGIHLNREEARAFAAVAGGRQPPTQKAREFWAILGRRSGKSRVAAALAVYFAVLVDHSAKLVAGEVGHILVLAASKDQARVIFRYAEGFLRSSRVMSELIEDVTAEEIRLQGNIIISVHAANFRTVRGRTLLACVFDECAFWRDEYAAQPDLEVYRAVLPALATTGGMLVAISSPYRRLGLLHTRHRDYFGKDDDAVLVVQGESRSFNPTLDPDIIRRATTDDPESALAEWEGQFRSDLVQFLDDQMIDDAIDEQRPLELPPRKGIQYRTFVDASAGRHDAFCIGIAHREEDRYIVDVVRGRHPPFDPSTVAAEFAALAKDYGCNEVCGDNFAGEWVTQAFLAAGTTFRRSSLPKSGLYLEGLPWFSRGAVSIPNVPRLIRELRLLERRVSRIGRDIIDHGKGGSDDYANVVFGALNMIAAPREAPCARFGFYNSDGITMLHQNSRGDWVRNPLADFRGDGRYGSSPDEFRRMLSDLSYLQEGK